MQKLNRYLLETDEQRVNTTYPPPRNDTDRERVGKFKLLYCDTCGWNIDPTTTEVDENTTPTDGVEGITDFEVNEYGGPCPPSGTHHYYFKLYALDTTLSIDTSSTATDLETMMSAHILEEAELIGLYSS